MTVSSGATTNDVIITLGHLLVAAFGIYAGMKAREHELKKRKRKESKKEDGEEDE